VAALTAINVMVRRWLPLQALLILPALVLPLDADAAEDHEAQRTCLAHTVYWEAKSEGREGMIAVGWVVLNRQNHEEFPPTLCGVVYEGGETPPCQFSWWCDGKSDQPREPENWALAREVADLLLTEPPPDPTNGALFFHSADIDVPWRVNRTRTAMIGNHIYYR
jgi:N-acetylmuramoyl-L-alanine amidase